MIRVTRTRTALAAFILAGASMLPLTQGAAPPAAHAASGPTTFEASLLGSWHNADPNTRGLRVLRITYDTFWHRDNAAAWGKCSPEDCSWGTVPVRFEAPPTGYAEYYLQSHVVYMTRVGSHLDVIDHFIPFPWDSRPSSTAHYTFVPGA
jgi:hypothetical protein